MKAPKEEAMRPVMTRMGEKHRELIKKLAEKLKSGHGEVVREAIEAFAKAHKV